MLEIVIAVVTTIVFFTLIWWAALIVLAIKGLLFHRPDVPPPVVSATADEELELGEVPSMPKGCLWALIFVFWPMAIGSAIDAWLTARERNRGAG